MPTQTTKHELKVEEIRLEQARQALAERQREEEERAARRERFRLNERIHEGVLSSAMSEQERRSNEEIRREWLDTKCAELQERSELTRADDERADERTAQERLLERLDLSDLPEDLRERLKIPVLVQERDDGTLAFKDDRRIVDDARLASG